MDHDQSAAQTIGSGGADAQAGGEAGSGEAVTARRQSELVRLYRGLLFRDPDPAELAAGESGSLVDTALGIIGSTEYATLNNNARYRVLVDLCRAKLGLAPSAEPIAAAERLQLSAVAGEIVDLLSHFDGAERPPEYPRGTTDEETTRLYRELLGREPESPAAVAQWRGKPILDVALSFVQSDEFAARFRAARDDEIARLYRDLLGREPHSQEEIAIWRGAAVPDVALQLTRSEEFQARMQLATEKEVARLYSALLRRGLREQGEIPWRGRPLVEVAINIARSEEAVRRQAAPQFFQPENLRRLHRIFLPDRPASEDWYREFSRIVRMHGLGVTEVVEYLHAMQLHYDGTRCEDPAVARALRARPCPWRSFGSEVTLVVPTVNSETWLEHVADFYAELGIPVLFAVDARNSDGTRGLLADRGAQFIEVSGEQPRIESLIPDILAKVPTKWVLRIDDDELPTPGLLNFVDQAVQNSPEFVWAFPVVPLRYHPGERQLQYSQFLSFYAFANGRLGPQARLFARDGIERLEDLLHTSGFVATSQRVAPAEALVLHFDWVLRSRVERLDKLRSYEAQDLVRARTAPHYTLCEMVPESWHMFAPLPDERYRDCGEKLYRSRDRRQCMPAAAAPAAEVAAAAMKRPVFKGFWHGPPLDPVRRACLQSFVKRGYTYELYTYEPVAVPPRVVLKDASAIMPREDLFYFGNADIAPFSDLFRAKLLLDTGGWWCDIDTICLSDGIPDHRYAWSREYQALYQEVSNGLIAGPKGDPIFLELYRRCRDLAPKIERRQELGAEAFTHLLEDLGLPLDMSGDAASFSPLSSFEVIKLWFPKFAEEIHAKIAGALFLPLYLSAPKIAGIDLEKLPPEGSFLAEILRQYLPEVTASRYDVDEAKDIVRSFVLKNQWARDNIHATCGAEMLDWLETTRSDAL